MQQNLSELKNTIEELQRLGTFSDTEVQWLRDLDKSISELSEEIGEEKIKISFLNQSNNTNPILYGNKIHLKTYLDSEILLLPHELNLIPTGIKLSLPKNIVITIKPIKEVVLRGLVTIDINFSTEDEIIIPVINFNTEPVSLTNGETLCELTFTYSLPDTSIDFKALTHQ